MKNSECTHIFQICKKKYRKSVTFTHGSKRDGMSTCIVMNLKTAFVNIYTHLKQYMSCFFNVQESHELKMFQISYL